MTIYDFLKDAPIIVGSMGRGYVGNQLFSMRYELEQVDIFKGKEITILDTPNGFLIENMSLKQYTVDTYRADHNDIYLNNDTFWWDDHIFIYSIILEISPLSESTIRYRVLRKSICTFDIVIDKKITRLLEETC
jgi:hypothetical protein